jgi:hypothetical protein
LPPEGCLGVHEQFPLASKAPSGGMQESPLAITQIARSALRRQYDLFKRMVERRDVRA